MDDLTAKVLALEALVLALARSHPYKQRLKDDFSQMFTSIVQATNKSDADHPGLGKKLAAECNRLGMSII